MLKRSVIIVIILLSPLFRRSGGSNAFSQNRDIDSVRALIKADKEDTTKTIHLNQLSFEFKYEKIYDSAITYGRMALSLAQKQNYKNGIALAYYNIAGAYKNQDDYLNALEYFFKSLDVYEKIKDKYKMGSIFHNLGIMYMYQSNYPKALDNYFKALKINEEIGNKEGMANNLGNIGAIYSDQGDDHNTLKYYMMALKIGEGLGNKNLISTTLGNIGIVYKEKKDYAKALDYYFRAVKISEELGNKNHLAAWFGNIGNVYDMQEQSGKALEYYLKALRMAEEVGNKNRTSIWLGNIGEFYIGEKKFKESFDYLYRALDLSTHMGAKNEQKFHYQMLSLLYQKSSIPLPDSVGGKMLNPEQMRLRALYYYKKHLAIRDTIFSAENKSQIVRKELSYHFENREASAKALQNKKDAISQGKLKQKEQERNYFIIGFALVALLALFILRGYRQKQKANVIITEQKTLVDEKQKEILDSIHYAKKIQTALMTNEKYIAKNLERLTN